jgi:hypothetical protein
MGSYGNIIIVKDASHDLSSAPHNFEEIRAIGENTLIQVNGSGLSGDLFFEQSIDLQNWSALNWIDEDSTYTQLSLSLSDPSINSIEIGEYTALQYIRLVLKTAGTGVVNNIKYLTS